MRRFLTERLPLAWKLRLRRAAYAPVAWALRASERARELAARLREGATASGFDLRGTRGAGERGVEPFGAADFLLRAHAASARSDESVAYEDEGPDAARAFKTSIVVPVVGDAELTFQCLRSLAREVDLTDTEVIIVNDSSDDATRELLSHFRGLVRVIERGARGGDEDVKTNRVFDDLWRRFMEACNRAAAEARGRHLVFLAGNASVARGWLDALISTLECDMRAGAVGSVSLDARGRVREAGRVVWSDGETDAYGRGRSAEDRRVAFAREVDYCSAASLAVRRELFERLGGFDASYASADYAAASLCMGVRSLGYGVVYQPASRVTLLEDASEISVRERAADRERFQNEWREALAREHVARGGSDLERAANRKWATQVAVFDDGIPTPDRDAGSARMLHILRALSEWSHVVLVTVSKQARPDYERALRREGIETAPAPDFLRLLRERHFRAAVLSRPHVAAGLLSSVRSASPRTRVIFDMVDAHSLRLSREHELTGDADALREAERYRRTESRLARECDMVWCASVSDEDFMRRLAPGVVAEVVPTIHPRRGRGLPFERREHLLFVGNFRHRPNADAVHFYAREVLPRVRESLPNVELLLVGDNAPEEFAAYASAGVRVLGYVPDIEPVLASARVSVAPLRFGAGINGKIGEALAHGLPVVTTNVGAAGLGLRDGEDALIADSSEDLAAATVRLYTDAALWRRLSDNGYEHVERHFSPRVVRKVVNDSVRSLLGHFKESLTSPRTTE